MNGFDTLRTLTTRLRFAFSPGDRRANQQYNAATQRTRATVNGLAAANAKLAASQAAVNNSIFLGVKHMGVYAAAFGGIIGGREIIQAGDSLDALNNRIITANNTVEGFTELRDKLTGVSLRTYSTIEDTTKLYQRYTIAAKAFGASQDEILRFTETGLLGTKVSGSNAVEAYNALFQTGQALGGNFRGSGQEINTLFEQAPALGQAALRGLGMSYGEMRDAAEAGQLSAKQFFDAIISQTEYIEAMFGKITVTQEMAVQTLNTGMQLFFGRLGQGFGANRFLRDLYVSIGLAMTKFREFGYEIGLAMRGAITALFDFQNAVFSVFNPIFKVAGGGGLGGLLTDMKDFFSIFNSLRAGGMGAGEAFRETLGMFFSPETAEALRRTAQSLVLIGKVMLVLTAAKFVKGVGKGIGSILGIMAGTRGGGKGMLKMVATLFSMKKAFTAIKTVGMLLVRSVFSPIGAAILALQVGFAAWNKENSNLKKLWEKITALWNGSGGKEGIGAAFDRLGNALAPIMEAAFKGLVIVVDSVAAALIYIVEKMEQAYELGKKLLSLTPEDQVEATKKMRREGVVGTAGFATGTMLGGMNLAPSMRGGDTHVHVEIKPEDFPKVIQSAETMGMNGVAEAFRRYQPPSN